MRLLLRLAPNLCLCAALAACAPGLPDTRETISAAARNAPYPNLEPLDQLLARANAGSSIEDDTDALAARVAGLKARAAALQGRSVFDGADRLRLQRAGARNATRLSQ